MKRRNTKGSILLAILLILPVVSWAILFLQKIKMGSFQREQVKQRIASAIQSGEVPPSSQAAELTGNVVTSPAPFLIYDHGTQSSSYLLRINSFSATYLPHPDWRGLARLQNIPCSNTTIIAPTRLTQAPITCAAVSAPIATNSVVSGNLLLADPLIISPSPSTAVVLAIAGELSASFQITLPANTHVELIAFGPIDIPLLALTPNTNSSLLIFSNVGSISIAQVTGAHFCTPGSPVGANLRLEAPGGVTLSGISQGTQTVGCAVPRSPETWPKSQILAANWP